MPPLPALLGGRRLGGGEILMADGGRRLRQRHLDFRQRRGLRQAAGAASAAARRRALRRPPRSAAGVSSKARSTSFCTSAERIDVGRIRRPSSIISSACFLRSANSASRSASWNWPWNSLAMRRTLPIHWPSVRRTVGSSFGPIAISATMPMTTSSPQPKLNMDRSTPAHDPEKHACDSRFSDTIMRKQMCCARHIVRRRCRRL